MIHRRRGVFLVEMLTVILMLGIGGTLLAVAFGSILRSQRRVAEFGNQYAQVNDFLRCFSRDVRMATTATLREGDRDDLQKVLVIGKPPRQVAYQFYKQHVERIGPAGGSLPSKFWNLMTADVGVFSSQSGAEGAAVSIAVHWRRTDAKDPEPNRRFDLVVRCAGELDHEED